jgi:hypothetical protein
VLTKRSPSVSGRQPNSAAIFVEKSEPPIGNRRPASSTIACRFFFRPGG